MKFWRRKEPRIVRPLVGKVEVFARHCLCSEISKNKKRPPGFSFEACFDNFSRTLDREEANLTLFLDRAGKPFEEGHFLKKEDPIVVVDRGSEAGAFLALLDHIVSLSIHPDTLIYIVEDDYLHRPGWISVLKEAFTLPCVDYATLYDHGDKYDVLQYPKLKSKIFATKSCHWRETPSTTHTFAVRCSSLMEDLSIHQKFSRGLKISADHQKFLKLGKRGRVLVSSIPGYATHMNPQELSPCFDWSSGPA